MKTLMYPLGPDDDFPDEFCAIRQGSGEHMFYTPAGESASWMLVRAETENAKLREHIADLWEFGFSKNAGANSVKEYLRKVDELRDRTYELGIEVAK